MEQPHGQFLLGVIAIGLAGYAIWRFVQSIEDTENKGSDTKGIDLRIGYAAIGFIYASLAVPARSDLPHAEWCLAWLVDFCCKPLGVRARARRGA